MNSFVEDGESLYAEFDSNFDSLSSLSFLLNTFQSDVKSIELFRSGLLKLEDIEGF
jgi:hypothetical protein